MKKFAMLIIVALSTINSFAQVKMNAKSSDHPSTQNNNTATYRLFPTQNTWTFIKLNTRNGQMWQVQYVINDTNRFETFLNIIPLVINPEDEINDRFTLYPTQNIWTFILLDQIDGRVWQVQWSRDFENRLVIPIK